QERPALRRLGGRDGTHLAGGVRSLGGDPDVVCTEVEQRRDGEGTILHGFLGDEEGQIELLGPTVVDLVGVDRVVGSDRRGLAVGVPGARHVGDGQQEARRDALRAAVGDGDRDQYVGLAVAGLVVELVGVHDRLGGVPVDVAEGDLDLAALAVVQRERLVGGEGILARALALTARSGLLLGGLLLGGLLLGGLLLGRLLLGRLLLGRLLLGGLLLCGFVLFRPVLGGGSTPGALATVPGEQEDPAPDDRDDQREDRAAGTDDDRDLGGVLLLRGRRLGLPEAGPEARRGRRGVLSVPPVALGRGRLTVAILLRLPVVPVPAVG